MCVAVRARSPVTLTFEVILVNTEQKFIFLTAEHQRHGIAVRSELLFESMQALLEHTREPAS